MLPVIQERNTFLEEGGEIDGKPRILYVATVDIMLRLMLPQLDALRAAGFGVEIACRITRHGEEMTSARVQLREHHRAREQTAFGI